LLKYTTYLMVIIVKSNSNTIVNYLVKLIKIIFILFYTVVVIGLILGGLAAGFITLIPDEASKPCYLGYYAHCSFTPYSTIILFAMTIIGFLLLVKLLKYYKRVFKRVLDDSKH